MRFTGSLWPPKCLFCSGVFLFSADFSHRSFFTERCGRVVYEMIFLNCFTMNYAGKLHRYGQLARYRRIKNTEGWLLRHYRTKKLFVDAAMPDGRDQYIQIMEYFRLFCGCGGKSLERKKNRGPVKGRLGSERRCMKNAAREKDLVSGRVEENQLTLACCDY